MARPAEYGFALWLLLSVSLLVFLTVPSAVSAEVSLSTTIDRSEITLGDPIDYRVRISYPAGVVLESVRPVDKMDPFEILDVTLGQPVVEGGRITTEDRYRISIYETGDFSIPPYTVRYRTSTGAIEEVTSESHPIHVQSISEQVAQAQDVLPLKDPLSLGTPLWDRLWPWLLASAILLIVCIVSILWLRRPKTPKPIPVLPPRPAHEIAFDALTRLRNDEEGLLRARAYEAFSIRVSAILRDYLRGRFDVPADDRTTEEILEALRPFAFREDVYARFKEFFEDCDLVKFARGTLNRDDMLYLIDLCWRQVEETYSRPFAISEARSETTGTPSTPAPPDDENRKNDVRFS
jgi:hypothetical protein